MVETEIITAATTIPANIRPERQRVPSLPNCAAEERQKYRTEYDAATNTSRRVFILPTDGERASLAAVIDNLRARTTPAAPGVCTALLEALKHMPRQKGAVEDWASFFRQAEFDLGEYSASHLQEALAEYRRTETFYPTIAAIVTICDRIRSYDEFRLRRAESALNGPDHKNSTGATSNDDIRSRSNGPRDFAALKASLMAVAAPVSPVDDTHPINTARAETIESLHDLSATLARRNWSAP